MLRLVFLILAMLLFVGAAFAKDKNSQMLAIGLVFFAGAFLPLPE